MTAKGLPGFRDFPPEDLALRAHIFAVWRDVAGSKIKALDWFKVAVSLGRIYFRYLSS